MFSVIFKHVSFRMKTDVLLLLAAPRLCNWCCLSVCLSLWAGLQQKWWADFTETWCHDWAYRFRRSVLTFVGDPVPDTDSGSLFHFPHHCGIGDVSCSHTMMLGNMTDVSDPADIQICINPEIRIGISDHFWLRFWHWQTFALSEHRLGNLCRADSTSWVWAVQVWLLLGLPGAVEETQQRDRRLLPLQPVRSCAQGRGTKTPAQDRGHCYLFLCFLIVFLCIWKRACHTNLWKSAQYSCIHQVAALLQASSKVCDVGAFARGGCSWRPEILSFVAHVPSTWHIWGKVKKGKVDLHSA